MAAATDRRAPLTHACQPMTLPLSPSEPGIEATVRPPASVAYRAPDRSRPAVATVETVDPAPHDAGAGTGGGVATCWPGAPTWSCR